MIILLMMFAVFAVVLVYSAIRVGDERKYLDEHIVALKIYRYYDQEKFNVIAEWSPEGSARCVTLHVYTRQRDPGTGEPQVEFLPQCVLRTNKETGEVYDWYEIGKY